MKKERLLILLGTLVALVFFYVGLSKWLESQPENEPPPVVVKPTPKQPASPQQQAKPKEEAKVEEKKQASSPEQQEQKEDLIAQKIQEEKNKEEKTKEAQKTQESKNLTAQKQKTQKESEKVEKVKEEKVQKNTVAKQEKQTENPKREVKEYVIQIGAFSSKENADRALEKAKSMGYRGEIVNEDNFYKVRVRVKTDDPKKVLAKLKATFGGAIIKQ
ncbi:MAG: SPOR domain-containing protein [Thermocrinis sp.]|nr:SPOR domain-containing protein [Thermocrinis sp.]